MGKSTPRPSLSPPAIFQWILFIQALNSGFESGKSRRLNPIKPRGRTVRGGELVRTAGHIGGQHCGAICAPTAAELIRLQQMKIGRRAGYKGEIYLHLTARYDRCLQGNERRTGNDGQLPVGARIDGKLAKKAALHLQNMVPRRL